MSNHLFSNLLFKVFPIVILMSVNSGCATKEQNYSAILGARPIPTSAIEIADECKWISQELAVINEKIETIKTTKGLAALKSATAIDKQNTRVALLNTRTMDIGCLELSDQPVRE
jgi:hypothetical protein